MRFSTVTSVDRIYYSLHKESMNGSSFVIVISSPMHQLKQMNFQSNGYSARDGCIELELLIGTSYVSNRADRAQG
ncbi:hypothetical protein OH492_01075 [Vibrio chagasii]|nr:hypothetical protein [Vibrio chagasii]